MASSLSCRTVSYSVILAGATCVAEMLGGGVVSLPYVVMLLSPLGGTMTLIMFGWITWFTGYLLAELYINSELHQTRKEEQCTDGVSFMHMADLDDDNDVDHSDDVWTRPSIIVNDTTDNIVVDDEEKDSCSSNCLDTTSPRENSSSSAAPEPPVYARIAREAIGVWGEWLTYACQSITLVFVNVIFLVLVGINISTISADSFSVSWGIYISAGVSLLCSFFLGKASHSGPFIWIAVLATFSGLVLRWVSVMVDAPSDPNKDVTPTFFDVLQAIGVIAFSFGGHSGFPTYQQRMTPGTEHLFTYSISIAYGYILALEVPFCLMVVLIYRGNLTPNFLQDLPTHSVLSTSILVLFSLHMIAAIATLVPPVANNLRHFLCWLFAGHEGNKFYFLLQPVVCCFLVQLTAVGLAVAFQEHFFIVMVLVGNTTIVLCTFVFPALFYLYHPNVQDDITLSIRVMCYICIVSGVSVGVLSIFLWIWNQAT